MKKLSRMAYVNIIDRTYAKLGGKEVTYENIKNSFEREEDFETLISFVRVYKNGMFKALYDEHEPEHIQKVMEFRREFFIVDPYDDDEYDTLLKYFASIEDYESCGRLKKNSVAVA
jgi:hypothetical protein